MITKAVYYVLGIPVFRYEKETDEPVAQAPIVYAAQAPIVQDTSKEEVDTLCPLCHNSECVCKQSGDGSFVL